MSWFDANSFTNFAKSAIEGAQRSIDKVLDIEDGGNSTSQVGKSDARGTAPVKQSKLGSKSAKPSSRTKKTISPPKTQSQRSKPAETSNNAENNSGGDFWSSFLGGYGMSGDDSSASKLSSSSSTNSSQISSKSISAPSKMSVSSPAMAATTSLTPTSSLTSTSSLTFTSSSTPTSSTTTSSKISSKSPTASKVSVSSSTSVTALSAPTSSLTSTSSLTDTSSSLPSSSKQSSQTKRLTHKSSNTALRSKKDENITKMDERTDQKCTAYSEDKKGNSEKQENASESSESVVSERKEKSEETESNSSNSEVSSDVKSAPAGLDKDNDSGSDNSPRNTSSDETKNKPSNDDSVSGTPDLLQNISSGGQLSDAAAHIRYESELSLVGIEERDNNIIHSSELIETDLQRSVIDTAVAKTKAPDMVEGLSVSENPRQMEEAGINGAVGFNLDLVCDSSIINRTQDMEPDFKPVDSSTPFPVKHAAAEDNEKLSEDDDDSNERTVHELPEVTTKKEKTKTKARYSIDRTEDLAGTRNLEKEDTVKRDSVEKDEEVNSQTAAVLLSEQALNEKGVAGKGIMSPVVDLGDEGQLGRREEPDKQVENLADGSMLTENLDSQSQATSNDSKTAALLKEIASLKEVVEARERKMVELSKDNIDLQETKSILRNQITQLESMNKQDDSELDVMREEFTLRVAATENKLQAAARERDQLKKELEDTTNHLSALNERQHEEFTTLISERDEQIAELLAEGEKLSKQELQSNTIIKKLRAKEKESDVLIKKQTKKIEELESEVKQLTDVLTSRDDSHSKQEDTIIKLDTFAKKQQEQIAKKTSELDDATEKIRSLETNLENAYKQLTELHKDKATKESMAQDAVMSAAVNAKEELRIALERARREFNQESEAMALQLSDLQTSLSRAEQQGTRREDSLRQEIWDLQERLQEAEARNQELATSVSHATRPLLRQIENLQSTHSNQVATWEKVEKNLTDRMNDAQAQMFALQEKERLASQNASQVQSRVSGLESQVTSYRADRSRLEAELDLERSKIRTLEDTLSRETAKAEASHAKLKKLLEEANQDKAHAEQQLTVEKSRMEAERKKLKSAIEERERRLSRQSSFGNFPPPSPTAPTDSSAQVETADPSSRGHTRMGSTGSSVVDGLGRGVIGGVTASVVERLQAQVRAKEGEIDLLQEDLVALEKSRDSVTEELARMTSKLEGLETSYEELTVFKTKYKELEQRYNAVLQMYGEKEEEAEELRMDLHDVKSMYKQQLEQLFGTR